MHPELDGPTLDIVHSLNGNQLLIAINIINNKPLITGMLIDIDWIQPINEKRFSLNQIILIVIGY